MPQPPAPGEAVAVKPAVALALGSVEELEAVAAVLEGDQAV